MYTIGDPGETVTRTIGTEIDRRAIGKAGFPMRSIDFSLRLFRRVALNLCGREILPWNCSAWETSQPCERIAAKFEC